MSGTKETKDKPLEKMTAKELRVVAEETKEITGAHGMNKPELIQAIKKVRGIVDEKTGHGDSVRDIKLKIRTLKAQRSGALTAQDRKKATILRRRINRLKKKTRAAA